MVVNGFKTGDPDPELPTGDLYFIFDGGRPGNEREYLRPFTGMSKVVKTILLHKEEESVQARMGKAMGIATVQLQENLMVVGRTRPECRKHSSSTSQAPRSATSSDPSRCQASMMCGR